jgi:hypothetical protein
MNGARQAGGQDARCGGDDEEENGNSDGTKVPSSAKSQ